jgi:hypothetical protein
MKDLVWKISFKLFEKVEVEISSNMTFLKLYPRRRESIIWGNTGDFKYIIL